MFRWRNVCLKALLLGGYIAIWSAVKEYLTEWAWGGASCSSQRGKGGGSGWVSISPSGAQPIVTQFCTITPNSWRFPPSSSAKMETESWTHEPWYVGGWILGPNVTVAFHFLSVLRICDRMCVLFYVVLIR